MKTKIIFATLILFIFATSMTVNFDADNASSGQVNQSVLVRCGDIGLENEVENDDSKFLSWNCHGNITSEGYEKLFNNLTLVLHEYHAQIFKPPST